MQNTHKDFQQLAIIGSTASGKTALAIKLAKKSNAHILSLDSLSVYKDIDTVSAKPTMAEREGIEHFGIDYIYPHQDFDVTTFISLYHAVYQRCLKEKKNLVIVGGTSFYLKMLIEGMSELPKISEATHKKATAHLSNLPQTYTLLNDLDPKYMSNITARDSYRIKKALLIYLQTGLIPSAYFSKFPPKAAITEALPIYQIIWQREALRERIALRTKIMLDNGLIDEICRLEKKYTRSPNCMKSIGIIETLAYLDGIYDKDTLIEKITIHTASLAKRQSTFNNSQFQDVIKGSVEELKKVLL